MREILWFRRDLRISDSAILSKAKDEVLPIFIFDTDILDKLEKNDRRVDFIYQSVLKLKKKLQSIGLDLAIFHDTPKQVFTKLQAIGFDRVLCSIDYDAYAMARDIEINKIIPTTRYSDSFILNPLLHLKKDGTPYKVFTPFFNSLEELTSSSEIEEFQRNIKLKKIDFDYNLVPTLSELGFETQKLPDFLYQEPREVFDKFALKMQDYKKDRDYFYKDATSNLSVFLRFGLISPKELFNLARKVEGSSFFIREIFWREFYAYLLFHFPDSEFENFIDIKIPWKDDEESFEAWCKGETGVEIVDASMKYLNKTGLMPNRLRMIVASFLTKNLLIDWRKGEAYFAKKLLDYEASSNIGSWQWAASTGADAAPYFRIFNP